MSSKLFEDKIRNEVRPSFGNENIFDYFNDTGRSDVVPIRELIESWYSIYPDSEKHEIKQRLKADFSPAFYELGMFSYFNNQGYKLSIHPPLPNTQKRTDFLAIKANNEFYVEIKEMRLTSDAERSSHRLTKTLMDSINRIDSSNFLLHIQKITLKNGKQPSGKKIVSYFNNIIRSFNPDFYRTLLENGGYGFMPYIKYEDETISINLKLSPKAVHLRGNNGRAIASYGGYSKIGGDEVGIRDALLQKAKRYSNLDKPFLICLNYPSSFLDEEDVRIALYGFGKSFDGFFGTAGNPKNTRVSAVLITGFTVSGLACAQIYYYKNPFAKREIAFLPSFDIVKSLGLNEGYISEFAYC
jgi:hypothetical protein